MYARRTLLLATALLCGLGKTIAQSSTGPQATGWCPDTVSVEEMTRHFQEWADDIPYRPEATLDRLLTNNNPMRCP